MPDLGQLELPSAIATLLRLRHEALPPLQLQDGANRAAKAALDALGADVELFGKCHVANAELATAVRGLLYLWTGWPHECAACGRQLGGTEGNYLLGLAARQLGETERSRQAFQQVGAHPIYPPLAAAAQPLIGSAAEGMLAQFQRTLEQLQSWDPFAFAELHGQCLQRKHPAMVERVVRGLQRRELEMLLVHCLEGVLGARLGRSLPRPVDEDGRRREREISRRLERAEDDRREKQRAERSRLAPVTLSPPAQVRIKCPKCRAAMTVAAGLRGKKTTCAACSAEFLVPVEKSLVGAAPLARPGGVGVRCPNCQHLAVLPPAARGQPHVCARCAAKFLIPN